MKLLAIDFDLDCLEFIDRFGIVRTVYGCSILGVVEFKARLDQLQSLLRAATATADATLADLYRDDRLFRHHCDCCLKLNGVDPDWLDGKGLMLERLLFTHEEQAGLLVRLNSPEKQPEPESTATGNPGTVYDTAAALLTLSNDLDKVIGQLQNLPAKQVGRIIEARAKHLQTPEDKKKDDRKAWAARMRSKPPTPTVINR